MGIKRRQFLQGSAAGMLLGLGGCSLARADGMLLGGYRTRSGNYGVAAIRSNGSSLWQRELPARLHEIAVQPEQQWVAAVARRPGQFISLLALGSGAPLAQIDAPPGLIFEGHALWRGTELWAMAATTDTSAARLLRYDLTALESGVEKPTDSLNLPGIGPHQALLLDEQIVVALGGWHTWDRDILNGQSFQSSLVRLDLRTGAIRSLASPQSDLSLRHLASDGQRIWAGLQYAIPRASDAPLVYMTDGQSWQALTPPAPGWRVFSGYIGSLAQMQDELVATSPQGHTYGRWNSRTGQCLETASMLDVCAAAAGAKDWFIASGTGTMRDAHSDWRTTEFFWDNHWTFLPG